MNQEENFKKIMEAIDKLAETYATDENGNFDLIVYMSYRAGVHHGLEIMAQVIKDSVQEE